MCRIDDLNDAPNGRQLKLRAAVVESRSAEQQKSLVISHWSLGLVEALHNIPDDQ
jgi:hypothetical protein